MSSDPPPANPQLSEALKKELKKNCVADFFQSDTLSDITITNPDTGANYK
jgi:hypothetical protein